MASRPLKPLSDFHAERERTDRSLEEERRRADALIRGVQGDVEGATADSVERARSATDESLEQLRVVADLAIEDVRQGAVEAVGELAAEHPPAAEVGDSLAQDLEFADALR